MQKKNDGPKIMEAWGRDGRDSKFFNEEKGLQKTRNQKTLINRHIQKTYVCCHHFGAFNLRHTFENCGSVFKCCMCHTKNRSRNLGSRNPAPICHLILIPTLSPDHLRSRLCQQSSGSRKPRTLHVSADPWPELSIF
jgi:hypothetical protein